MRDHDMGDSMDRGLMKEQIQARVPLAEIWYAIVEPVVKHLRLQVGH
jgi:hypothetical protein